MELSSLSVMDCCTAFPKERCTTSLGTGWGAKPRRNSLPPRLPGSLRGGDRNLESLWSSLHSENRRSAVSVLEIGEQRAYGVQSQIVDPEHPVAGLKARLLRRGIRRYFAHGDGDGLFAGKQAHVLGASCRLVRRRRP